MNFQYTLLTIQSLMEYSQLSSSFYVQFCLVNLINFYIKYEIFVVIQYFNGLRSRFYYRNCRENYVNENSSLFLLMHNLCLKNAENDTSLDSRSHSLIYVPYALISVEHISHYWKIKKFSIDSHLS